MPAEKGVWHESGKTRRADGAKASLRNKGAAAGPRLAQYRWQAWTAGSRLGIINRSHVIRVTPSVSISASLPAQKQVPPSVRESKVGKLPQDSINRRPTAWNLVNEPEPRQVELPLKTLRCIGNRPATLDISP